MYKNIKKNNQGFTIVETLIVLAIAGLIILIVLLAVPALQRSSRNTNIKSDASAVAGGINSFESNNNGVGPTSINSSAGVVTFMANGMQNDTAKVQGSTVVTTVTSAPTTGGSFIPGDIGVWPGHACPATTGGAAQASTRAYAIFYLIENSGGVQLECLDS